MIDVLSFARMKQEQNNVQCCHHQCNIIDRLRMREDEENLDKKDSLLEKRSSLPTSSQANHSIEKYRKRLLAQVITIFMICLIVILERVFYQIIVDGEDQTLASLQLKTGLVQQGKEGIIAKDITNPFFQFMSAISQFKYSFLILTHFLATIYVAFDSLIATKVCYVSMGVIYVVSVIQMFYAGPRPFWYSDEVFGSSCLPSYNHPSLGLILVLFVPLYTYECWRNKPSSKINEGIIRKHYLMVICMFVAVLALQFLNYLTGTMYIINIAMSLVIGTLIFMVVISANSIIDKAVKKSTILKTDAKKYIFYWLLLICLLATFVLIIFSGQDLFLDIDWVENYMSCTRYLKYPDKTYRYDEIIGPWFNFIQTSTLFGWIGAVFGISACFRKIPNIEWAAGSKSKRITRAMITNMLIMPSWVFMMWLQPKGSWVKDIGLNDFMVNALHFFILYIWIFGYMPIVVLHRSLKLTNREEEDFYVIVQDSMIKE